MDHRVWPWVLGALLWSAAAAFGEEPGGFLDRSWGTSWTDDAIRSLAGCDGQGEIVANVEGMIARVAQPECVGYRLSAEQTVNLILFYPEIRWHRLAEARAALRPLVELPRAWGLEPTSAERLAAWLRRLERLSRLRAAYGDDPPAFPDLGHFLVLPPAAQGLQGYQLNFPWTDYERVKSLIIHRLGPPTRTTMRVVSAVGEMATGEVLEWAGEQTTAALKEYGGGGPSGHFVVVTRAYRAVITGGAASGRRASHVVSYPWFLELIEGFRWARD